MGAPAHQHPPPNLEVLSAQEIAAVRRQLAVEVAMRLSGLQLKPVEELGMPAWVESILRAILTNFRMGYPDGLPAGRDGERIVAREQRRVLRWFDDELTLRQRETA